MFFYGNTLSLSKIKRTHYLPWTAISLGGAFANSEFCSRKFGNNVNRIDKYINLGIAAVLIGRYSYISYHINNKNYSKLRKINEQYY